MVTIRRMIVIAAGICFFGGLMSNVYLELHYANAMPHSPDISSRRTFEVSVNHNTRVWVTEDELRTRVNAQRFFMWGGSISFVLIALMQSIYKVF